ncbi:MAG: 50S ribosome-binding GTPase [Wolbachia endosymbiont of Meromenopon meropis]|nr:50S ribosome-binding GTPase [Wolbachia endosymbiont of Meromenopon meropis]
MILNTNFALEISDIKSLPCKSISEITFADKSNVEKSTLINLLIDNKKAGKVSAKPWYTGQINFHSIYNSKFNLIDLPRYGYAYIDKKETGRYLDLVEYYSIQRKKLIKSVCVVKDSKIGLK